MLGGRFIGCSLLLSICLLGVGCSNPKKPQLPAGAWIAGRVPALTQILANLEQLEGTPVARSARSLRERLKDCDEFLGNAEPGAEISLIDAIECRPSDPLPPAVSELREDGDLVFILPVGSNSSEENSQESRLLGRVYVDARTNVRVEARFDRLPKGGVAAFLLPAKEPLGALALDDHDSLIHARVRPRGGLDIASLVPEGSQGDSMFKLKSALFSKTVLDGSLELAVYMPGEGRSMPFIALAAGVRNSKLVQSAMAQFLQGIEQRWAVHHMPREFNGREGACMPELRLFPELAPCYARFHDSLIFGWNAESLEKAMPVRDLDAPTSSPANFIVHLDRLAEADQRLHDALTPGSPMPSLRYGWDRLRFDVSNEAGEIHFHLKLERS